MELDGKTKAIIAHIYWIGWVIALVLNSNDKDEFTSFYLRQLLGLFLFSVVVAFIPIIQFLGWIVALVFWVISLVGAINGEKKEIPFVGHLFEDWFKGI